MKSWEKKATGHQLHSLYSACKLQLGSYHLSHRWPSTPFLSMDSVLLFVLLSSSALGRVSPMKSRGRKHWWSCSSAATWWGTRRTWSPRRSVIAWFKRSFGSLTCTSSWRARVWPAQCIQTLTISIRSKGRNLISSISWSARVGMLLHWSRRSSPETARLTMTSDQPTVNSQLNYKLTQNYKHKLSI